MANDNRYVSKSNFIYIWNSIWRFIASKFVRKEVFNKEIIEVKESIVGLANADEVYIMTEDDTESDIPENTVIAIFPDEDAKKVDWTNYYNKDEINEIIIRADFKKGKSAYEVAVEQGFEGSEEDWLLSLKGKNAYEIACELGFEGSIDAWLESLKGYTPQKGIDYFDGYTPQKNVDYFDGYTPQKDKDYFDGYTPQREVDYWTASDVASIQTYVDILVAELVDSAPDELNTLWELANALGNDPNFATTVLNKIGEKADKSKLSKVATSNDYNDLDNKPTIPTVPTKLSELDNDEKFVKLSEVEAMFTEFANTYLAGRKIRVGNYTPEDGFFTFKKKG